MCIFPALHIIVHTRQLTNAELGMELRPLSQVSLISGSGS